MWIDASLAEWLCGRLKEKIGDLVTAVIRQRRLHNVSLYTRASEEQSTLMKAITQKLKPESERETTNEVACDRNRCPNQPHLSRQRRLTRVAVLSSGAGRNWGGWHFHNLTWTQKLTLRRLIPSTTRTWKGSYLHLIKFRWGKWIHPFFFSSEKILKVKIHSLDLRDSEFDAAWWEIFFFFFDLRESISLALWRYNIFQAYD